MAKCALVLTIKVAIRMLNVRRGFVSITSSCWTTWTRCSQGLSATSTSSRCSTRRSGTTSELSERLPSRTNVFCPLSDESRQRRSSSSMSRLTGLGKVTSGGPSLEMKLQVKTITIAIVLSEVLTSLNNTGYNFSGSTTMSSTCNTWLLS